MRAILRVIRVLLVGVALLHPSTSLAQTPPDADNDGLPDTWETAFGLKADSASALDGAGGDPDQDGLTNLAEFQAGSHPRGFFSRRLAEGASNGFFHWQLALANPEGQPALVQLAFQCDDGRTVSVPMTVNATSRRTVLASEIPGLSELFSLTVESDRRIGVDRTMSWANGTGSHAESSVAAPARRWFHAEGATGGAFNLFYLIQNPSSTSAEVSVTFLLPTPEAPVVRTYTVGPHSRFTIWVDEVDPALSATDVSADIVADTDIVVERAMYMDVEGAPFRAGHASAGVTAPSTDWFLAEGATGPYFDEFVLIANPSTESAEVQVEYSRPDGMIVPRLYTIAGRSRFTIWVDQVHPWLQNTPVSVHVRAINGVALVVERTMWWSDGGWFEAHNSPGATGTGTRWLAAEGEVGGSAGLSTYVLLANTSSHAGQARVTLLFEDSSQVARLYSLNATSRFNVNVGEDFPTSAGRRFATLVESLGSEPAELVVEWSMYASPGGIVWESGANALAMNLSPPLLTLNDVVLFRGSGTTYVETFRRHPGAGQPVFSVVNSTPAVATATIDAATGRLSLVPRAANGTTTITVTATNSDGTTVTDAFTVTLGPGRPVQFATPVPLISQLFPAVADFNGDGWHELTGSLNDGAGRLVPLDLRAIGLGPIVDLSSTADNRENRPVDVNGDGRLDLVSYTYLPVTDPRSVTRLYLGQPDGTFAEDPAFAALDIRGFGHTIVAGDYDNDGDSDLFLTEYTHNDPREQFFLLLNDGTGRFSDVADQAGIATRGWPAYHKVEGAQALDFDGDGDLDIFAASHFYFNQGVVDGVPRFVDRRAELNLPLRFDEGVKFLDFDNDGRLDLMLHHPSEGPQLHRFDGTRFELVALPVSVYDRSYGANVADMNGDGLEDIILAPGGQTVTRILLNTGSGFQPNPPTSLDGVGGDTMAFGDFNGDGRLDIGRRGGGGLEYALNTTSHNGLRRLAIEVVGRNGERNQFGRVVRVTPLAAPGVTYTRVVDGGSGFIAQSQYPLLIGTSYTGRFSVTVTFASGTVTFEMAAGQRRRVYEDGRVEAY